MKRIVVALMLLAILGGVAAWAKGTATSSASNGQLHNCPPASRWSIATWDGADGTSTEEAVATCGEGAVAAAYYIDPESQVWSRWFAGRAEISNLDSLNGHQGVLALGSATGPTATPTATATPPEETGYLPPPQEVGDINAGGNAVVTIVNDTPYALTLEFEGPTMRTTSIPACETCHEYSFVGPLFCPTERPEGSVTLPPGTYDVTATVDDPSVIPFAGEWTLEGDTQYGHCFYIVTSFG